MQSFWRPLDDVGVEGPLLIVGGGTGGAGGAGGAGGPAGSGSGTVGDPVILEDVSVDSECQTGACDWEVDVAASRMVGEGVGIFDGGFSSSLGCQ